MGQLSVNTRQKLDDLVHTSVNHFRSAGYSTTSLSLLKTPIGPLLTKMSSWFKRETNKHSQGNALKQFWYHWFNSGDLDLRSLRLLDPGPCFEAPNSIKWKLLAYGWTYRQAPTNCLLDVQMTKQQLPFLLFLTHGNGILTHGNRTW